MDGRTIKIGVRTESVSVASESANAKLGMSLMLLATVFFAFQDSVTKVLVQHYPIWQLVFVRFLVLSVVITAVSFWRGGPVQMVQSTIAPLHLLRGVIVIGEVALVSLSLRHLGLAEAMTIFHLFPIIGVGLSILFLRERVAVPTVLAIGLGFYGFVTAAAPSNELNAIGVLAALGAAVLYAIYIVLTRFVADTDSPLTSLFYICVAGVILPLVLFSRAFVPIQTEHVLLFVLLCTFNIVAQCSVVFALSFAQASLLQPINYFQVLWAAIIGMMLFSEVPTLGIIVGGVCIVGAGLLLVRWGTETAP